MTVPDDPLARLAARLPTGTRLGLRVIAPGDEAALLAAEAASLTATRPADRRASGAARRLARGLLGACGQGEAASRRGRDGAPVWP